MPSFSVSLLRILSLNIFKSLKTEHCEAGKVFPLQCQVFPGLEKTDALKESVS